MYSSFKSVVDGTGEKPMALYRTPAGTPVSLIVVASPPTEPSIH